MTNLIDYFAVLEINPNATIDEINRAYRKQALLWHPDKQKTQNERLIAEERFKLIGEAYECLSNLGLRKQYDEVFNREKNNCSDFQSQARLAQLVKLFHEQHGLVGFFPLHEINIVDVMTVRHSFSVDPFLNIYLQNPERHLGRRISRLVPSATGPPVLPNLMYNAVLTYLGLRSEILPHFFRDKDDFS